MSDRTKEQKRLRRLRWRELHGEQWREEKRQYARRKYEQKCREEGREPKPYTPVFLFQEDPTYFRLQRHYGKWGITNEEYVALFDSQRGRCAICTMELKPKRGSLMRKGNVDHDHSTNFVRGLLCTPCNQGIGMFKDDVWRMKRAIEYLDKARRIAASQGQHKEVT